MPAKSASCWLPSLTLPVAFLTLSNYTSGSKHASCPCAIAALLVEATESQSQFVVAAALYAATKTLIDTYTEMLEAGKVTDLEQLVTFDQFNALVGMVVARDRKSCMSKCQGFPGQYS